VFWHVYPPKFASTAFNPTSDSRFALRPDRAMYYAGATPSAALWETVLRDLVPDRTSRAVEVPSDPRHIAQVRLLCDVPVLELIAPRVNEIAVTSAFREELQIATVQRHYPATHAIARELLTRYPDAAGLYWHSRQVTSEVVAVFYQPPGLPDWFAELAVIPLSSAEGLTLIDDALAEYNLLRVDTASLAESATPPPGVY